MTMEGIEHGRLLSLLVSLCYAAANICRSTRNMEELNLERKRKKNIKYQLPCKDDSVINISTLFKLIFWLVGCKEEAESRLSLLS